MHASLEAAVSVLPFAIIPSCTIVAAKVMRILFTTKKTMCRADFYYIASRVSMYLYLKAVLPLQGNKGSKGEIDGGTLRASFPIAIETAHSEKKIAVASSWRNGYRLDNANSTPRQLATACQRPSPLYHP